MGSACCVAAKDRTIVSRPRPETLQRHVRYSPTWSFRWDNRVRVAGEETSRNWSHDEGQDILDAKYGPTVENVFASEEGSPLYSLQSLPRQKAPVTEGNHDQAISRNLVEVKESKESPSISHPSPVKLSSSAPSASCMLASAPSSQNQRLPPKSTPRRWHHQSPVHQLFKLSDSPIPEHKSPKFSISEENYELNRGSTGGSPDSWSLPVLTELMTTRRERWSFDSENSLFSRDRFTRSSGRNSRSSSIDLQTCGICTKLLNERSSWAWNNQKIISNNDLNVVSVLHCEHVYHAECLECMTPEVDKFDPSCPVCTYGQKRAVKMSEKALKAELDLKARKRSRKRVVNSDMSSDIVFDDRMKSGAEVRSPELSSSSSMKSSREKNFLKRHFSFGLQSRKSFSESHFTRRKGSFWARSSKD